jgi:hypothetical protein
MIHTAVFLCSSFGEERSNTDETFIPIQRRDPTQENTI